MAVNTTKSEAEVNAAFVAAARRIHEKDGECEIDEGATVSISDDGGAYVQAWVWVYNTDAGFKEDEEETEEERLQGVGDEEEQ